MKGIPHSCLTRIAVIGEFSYSIIAVMHEGQETYRYLKQLINNCTPSAIAYESVFSDKDEAIRFWSDEVHLNGMEIIDGKFHWGGYQDAKERGE